MEREKRKEKRIIRAFGHYCPTLSSPYHILHGCSISRHYCQILVPFFRDDNVKRREKEQQLSVRLTHNRLMTEFSSWPSRGLASFWRENPNS
jgi:hypothetical protein